MKRLKISTFRYIQATFILTSMFSVTALFSQKNANTIDFGPGSYKSNQCGVHNSTDNSPIDNSYYNCAYGIRFLSMDNNGNILLSEPLYSEVGGPARAFVANNSVNVQYESNKATSCVGYSGNSDHPISTSLDEGCWFMTDDDGIIASDPNTILIQYDRKIKGVECTFASGYLIDVDADEAFHITAISDLGVIEDEVVIISNSYNGPTANIPNGVQQIVSNGDASSTYFELSTTNFIDNVKIDYIGRGDRGGDPGYPVGIAFDEFSFCAPSACAINSDIQLVNRNDGSGRIQLFDISAPSSNTKIVSRTWTIETLNTNRQYIAGGVELDYYVPISDNYLVCLETVAVNEFTGECCTSRECEWFYVEVEQSSCQLDPSFSYSCFTNDCIFKFKGNSGNSNRNIRSWYWDFGDGNFSYDKNPVHAYEQSGTYEICLTIVGDLGADHITDGACCTETYCRTILFDCIGVLPPAQLCDQGPSNGIMNNNGIENQLYKRSSNSQTDDLKARTIDKESFKLSPNPVKENVTLEFYMRKSENVSIVITNLSSGHKMPFIKERLFSSGQQKVEINTEGFEAGSYLVTLITQKNIKTLKMLVVN